MLPIDVAELCHFNTEVLYNLFQIYGSLMLIVRFCAFLKKLFLAFIYTVARIGAKFKQKLVFA
jgi:hypothetical protein